jgi:hypothetical protein
MRIFISHSKKDIAFVKELRTKLQSYGYELWFDEEAIFAGEAIIEKISIGLDQCNILCLINSKNSILSKWVDSEIKLFYSKVLSLNQNKKIIVLKIDNTPVP